MQVNIAEIHVFIEFCYFNAISQSLLLFEELEFVKIFQGLCLFGGLRLLFQGTFPGSMPNWGSTLIRKSRVCKTELSRKFEFLHFWTTVFFFLNPNST